VRTAGLWACLLASSAVAPALADEAAMGKLAAERGCANCHREAPAAQGWDKLVPLTPSWREIAVRYRASAGAEDALTTIVLSGTGPARGDRHWKGVASIPGMPPNRVEVTPAEARDLVRWILSKPG
jgi:cytochrome c